MERDIKSTIRVIGNESYEELKNKCSTVPRDNSRSLMSDFIVGKTYKVKNNKKSDVFVYARCTQDCPHHLIKI